MSGPARAQDLHRAVRGAGTGAREVWFRAPTLGGEVGELAVDACLHGCRRLPRTEQELLSREAAQPLGAAPPPGGGPRPAGRC